MAFRGFNANKISTIKSAFNSCNDKINTVSEKIRNFEVPERFKGTFVERWGLYWKNLYIDYKEVAVDVVKDCRSHPVKASFYATILGSSYYCAKHNPDETSFREQLIQDSLKLMSVGESIRNPESSQQLKFLETCYNRGLIRYFNLGIFSIIWIDNYDETCALYKAICPYLKPRYLTFYERVIDVGFLDKWWILDKKMIDYDVNENEFKHLEVQQSSNVLVN